MRPVFVESDPEFLPLDMDGYIGSKNVNGVDGDYDYDDANVDVDDYPLIGNGPKTGSGVSGAVFNLTTTIIGAGIMALPATMKVLGLVLGFVLIVLMDILSEISMELLVRFSVFCKASSYGEVWLGNGFWDHRMLVIFIILVLFLAPLCVLDKIDSLSMTSAASMALAVVFVIVCFIAALIKLVEGKIEAPRMSPDFGSKKAILDLLVVIPIMSNAYVCHLNLENWSLGKMYRVGRITTVIFIMVYASIAVSGYLLFGRDTKASVLTNFNKDLGIRFSSTLNYIVRAGYILHLVLVFPVIHFLLRQMVDVLLFEKSAPLSESRKRCLALTVVLLMLIYIGSTMIPNIWTAFKFIGTTTTVSLGLIFPSHQLTVGSTNQWMTRFATCRPWVLPHETYTTLLLSSLIVALSFSLFIFFQKSLTCASTLSLSLSPPCLARGERSLLSLH
ncbi:hypothetical protein ACJRO7_025721 [Eucalyptus globulus]|uniref:Amino acid transporter transmembrane domain-containing protein n=1 Tax=Eucalyptus globulus TaxID=34317 RepID=A0ABD3K9W2_EUCGL